LIEFEIEIGAAGINGPDPAEIDHGVAVDLIRGDVEAKEVGFVVGDGAGDDFGKGVVFFGALAESVVGGAAGFVGTDDEVLGADEGGPVCFGGGVAGDEVAVGGFKRQADDAATAGDAGESGDDDGVGGVVGLVGGGFVGRADVSGVGQRPTAIVRGDVDVDGGDVGAVVNGVAGEGAEVDSDGVGAEGDGDARSIADLISDGVDQQVRIEGVGDDDIFGQAGVVVADGDGVIEGHAVGDIGGAGGFGDVDVGADDEDRSHRGVVGGIARAFVGGRDGGGIVDGAAEAGGRRDNVNRRAGALGQGGKAGAEDAAGDRKPSGL